MFTHLKYFASPAGKRRRAEASFPGADVILKQISEKPSRKRVGIISTGPPARGTNVDRFNLNHKK
jgi:hypothetical protein